ncbi:prepilin-type N-terminal cleavage/methylation domain-containing protein [Desulfobacula sp.]|uniref:type IV pilus modification PilV family protein n=1 Tax=Desulfobacula sp. TaxID=2593537 RepID=UPI0025C29D88|nr:prepilin-type N-terminal cleavage/methylation domain-containing protein [Desulfobacula sp.]MBC2704554.1 prepilin-type N-terminal cleavage/methylation domain-containing protein [Desulfobacula sp.]
MFTLKTASKYILRAGNSNGFTLLEVMISVSIIALVFVSLFRMQSSTIELAAAGKFNSIAPILANQVLVKIKGDIDGWSEPKGDFGDNFPGIEWTCKILDSSFEEIEFISEENRNAFKKIEIEITDPSGPRSYKINTWRFAGE